MFADDVSDTTKAMGTAAFSLAALYQNLPQVISVLGGIFTVVVCMEKAIKYAIWIWQKLHKVKSPPDPTEP